MDTPSLGFPHSRAQVEDDYFTDWLDMDAISMLIADTQSGPHPPPCLVNSLDPESSESSYQMSTHMIGTGVPDQDPSSILGGLRTVDSGDLQLLVAPMDVDVLETTVASSTPGKALDTLLPQVSWAPLPPDSLQPLVSGLEQELHQQQPQILQQQNQIQSPYTHSQQHHLCYTQHMVLSHAVPHLQHQVTLQQFDPLSCGLLHQTPAGTVESVLLDGNQVLCSQAVQEEQQMIGLLFSPTLASCPLSQTPSSVVCPEQSQGYDPQEGSSSSIQSAISNPRKRIHSGEDHNEMDMEKQAKPKRPRKALQIQKRLAVIEFWESNRQLPLNEISTKFNIPRTTIYGIIKNRDTLKRITKSHPLKGLTLERCSTIQSRFRILEELLFTWYLDLRSHGVDITNRKITAQAFDIHRMLSGLLWTPLPPCMFSARWLQGFKKRRMISLSLTQDSRSATSQDKGWDIPEDYQRRFSGDPQDVYVCGLTSLHTNLLPVGHYDESHREPETTIMDSNFTTVVLCCNATLTNRRASQLFAMDIVSTLDVILKGAETNPVMETFMIVELAAWLIALN